MVPDYLHRTVYLRRNVGLLLIIGLDLFLNLSTIWPSLQALSYLFVLSMEHSCIGPYRELAYK